MQKIIINLINQYPFVALSMISLSIITGTGFGFSTLSERYLNLREEMQDLKKKRKKEHDKISDKILNNKSILNKNHTSLSNILTVLKERKGG